MLRCLPALLLVSSLPALSVNFDKDLAPVVYQHCAPCHHQGSVGPFPLMTYSDLAKHAAQIVTVTASRYMPPWPPARGYGEFAGDRSLTDDQIRLFAEWVKEGKPEGQASDLPDPPRFNSEWQLGPPDLILRMDKPFTLPSDGSDIFRNLILRTGLSSSRHVRGFELHMDNPRVVHHANVVLDRTHSMRSRDGVDGQPGFPGMDIVTEAAANNFDPDSHFLFYKPGSVLNFEPAGMAWELDPGTDLVLNLHLRPSGKPEQVQGEIGLYFTDLPPTLHPMLVELEHDGAIHIPPGSRSSFVTDSLVLPSAVKLLAVYPHAHYLGKKIDAWAVLPNGNQVPLIRITDWDINWQAVYDYKEPVLLPKGTRLEMRVTYDNSADNPRNPSHPPVLVKTGDRSEDEMGHVWFQLLPVGDDKTTDPRLPIQEAVMRRRLEKYPADFLAHYNLAALLESEGKVPQAIPLYKQAVADKPSSATVHNSLATAYLLQGDVSGAVEELRKAIKCDSTYLSAHFNLARALEASGNLTEAAAEYQIVLQTTPDDADANAHLGSVEYRLRQYGPSLQHLTAASKAHPDDADLRTNLGTVLALTGDLYSAQQAFEAALRIDPSQSAAKANLQIIRAKLAQH